jgi:hypothetical protein
VHDMILEDWTRDLELQLLASAANQGWKGRVVGDREAARAGFGGRGTIRL